MIEGGFSCVFAELNMERLIEFYLIQVFIPNILIVVLSWMAFWIDAEAVPGRVTIGIITVLTATSQTTSALNSLPKFVHPFIHDKFYTPYSYTSIWFFLQSFVLESD